MSNQNRRCVIMLPGIIVPARLAFTRLQAALGAGVEAKTKDLEVYRTERPALGYSLTAEVKGITREADIAGFDRFHLIGFSAGGACALLYTATFPGRVLSLALIEPAWAGNPGLDREEQRARQRFYRSLRGSGPKQFMANFAKHQLRPDVPLPSERLGIDRSRMTKHQAAISAITEAFQSADLDLDALRGFRPPVYFALGGLSNPHFFETMASRLRGIFADFELEVFQGRHHFDPPHLLEPRRTSHALLSLWQRAETTAGNAHPVE